MKIILLLIATFLINHQLASQPEIEILIKDIGAVNSEVKDNQDIDEEGKPVPLDNELYGDIKVVENLFSNVDFGIAPDDTTANLGVGYNWQWDLPIPPYYWTAPCYWYEIHVWDKSGELSPNDFIVKRYILDKSIAAWNSIGELSTNPFHTNTMSPVLIDDISEHYMMDVDGNKYIDLDPPNISPSLFLVDSYNGYPIDIAKSRTNFAVVVEDKTTLETLKQEVFKVQIHAEWSDASGNIIHASSYLKSGERWTGVELDYSLW